MPKRAVAMGLERSVSHTWLPPGGWEQEKQSKAVSLCECVDVRSMELRQQILEEKQIKGRDV